MSDTRRVLFLSASTLDERYYLRQLPRQRPVWSSCEFRINDYQAGVDVDCCVVYDDVREPVEVSCKSGARILFTAEPPQVCQYDRRYLEQFDLVVTVDPRLRHSRKVYDQQCLTWMVGWKFFSEDNEQCKGYDYFAQERDEDRIDAVSMIASKKAITKGHVQRYEFALALKEHFKDKLQLFGVGIREVEDKLEAMAPYKYTLSIENSSLPYYWTEKISDAFLAGCYPFYHGCTNLEDYFAADSFTSIEPDRLKDSTRTIEAVLESELWSRSREQIRASKKLVLDEYNLFAVIAGHVRSFSMVPGEARQSTTIFPRAHFQRNSVVRRAAGFVRHKLGSLKGQ